MGWRPVGGFTLVEVLVALFVLAVGIAGASACQLAAARSHHQWALMANAVQLAGSLAERMRANPVVMAAADGANPYLQLRFDAAADPPPAPSAPCIGTADCDAAQLAAFDLADTVAQLRAGFPGGRIVVCRDATLWDAARAALAWDCAHAAGAPVVIKLGWRGNEPDVAGPAAPSVALVVPGAG
jgi:type IV pilus assembly protein PilV